MGAVSAAIRSSSGKCQVKALVRKLLRTLRPLINSDDRRRDVAHNDLDSAIEQSHTALAAIFKGDSGGDKVRYSEREDVTLGNLFGPYARGRKKVEETLAGAASHYRDGEVAGVELITTDASGELACVVEVDRRRSKVGAGEELVPATVRVTSLFRLKVGACKLVHRQADPITTPRPAASVIAR